MTTRLLLLADTHVPLRARRLPRAVWRAIDDADAVIHAGDWVDLATLDAIERRARRLIAVYGNNDGSDLRARLPEVARAEVAGLRLAVVHETGAAAGRERRLDAAFAGEERPALVVFGHSHIPWDSVTPAGMRLLNPGSPTDRRRQPECTMMTVDVDRGRIGPVELIAVPRDAA